MLFSKYQYRVSEVHKRGYSQSCLAFDEHGKHFWVKWILGIDKTDTKAKLLSDRLRHLQKARHVALPEIIEYGYDEEEKAFAIVYENLENVERFEDKLPELHNQGAISGLIDIANCLQELHLKYKINHGDIHPGNILIDKNGQFYLVDFGLADITKTLSQAKDLEVFASSFAAPEKLSRLTPIGFPYQSDIYSFGRVIVWFYNEKSEHIPENQAAFLDKILSETPSYRPTWQQVLEFLNDLAAIAQTETIQIGFRSTWDASFLDLIDNSTPIYDISPSDKGNYLMDIIVGDVICEGVLWIKDERRLLFDKFKPFSSLEQKFQERKIREGKKLPFSFKYDIREHRHKADLTPYFQKWLEGKKKQVSLRQNRNAVRNELGFYTELLKEELKVISSKALRLQYSGFEIVGQDEIHFKIKPNEKNSKVGYILRHIEEGNDVNSEGFLYVISANADRKQSKEVVEFAGKPYDFESGQNILKIKDCERLKRDRIPQSGFLFENTNKKEEEKNRQLEAIRKVDKNEVQNPDLIYYLFKPDELPVSNSDYSPLEKVWQRDKNKQPLKYSDNQNKAIRNALSKTPLSVIQGPPGTGKTTVITEIVFQLLAHKPEAKILITSQTNNAVDQVLENLLKNEIPILRLSGITPPKIQIIKKHTLDRKLEGWKQQVKDAAERNFKKLQATFISEISSKNPFAESIVNAILDISEWKKATDRIYKIVSNVKSLHKLLQLPSEKEKAISIIDEVFGIKLGEFIKLHGLHRDWINTIVALDEKSAINQKLIDSIRVIGATCNHIASKKYSKYNFDFDYVIMDESGKATTAESLVPIIMAKNLIYVGDHRQLRPMLTSAREVESWLRGKFKKEADEFEDWDEYFNRPSLFEQVITKIDFDYKAQLTECRRSSAEQVKLTSICFYQSEGDEQIQPVLRDKIEEHNIPLAIDTSIVFVDIGSHYKNETDGEKNKSSLNKVSAELIPQILEQLNKYEKVKDYSVGVITGYTAQYRQLKKEIDKKIRQSGLNNVRKWNKQEEKLTVSVVDRFQGLERDIVIVDLVKSGPGLNLGFLEVPNRINVALSRQKKLLVIVGDYYSIVNAKTKRLNGKKAALQKYLEAIKPDWRVKAEDLNRFFK